MAERIRQSNIEEFIKSKILDYAVDRKETYTRIFYHGLVINNNDPLNANRVKIRVPLLDDTFYVDKTKEEGDQLLPWCMPMNRNFVQTPENNSIVLVAIFDPKIPYYGRIYFDSIASLDKNDLFNQQRLSPETGTYDNWTNAENALSIILKSKPKKAGQYNVNDNVKFDMGIRGKGKNRITLRKDSLEIYQNEGTNSKESMLAFTQDIKLEAAEYMDLLSKKGGTKFHPVFDEPLYDYLHEMNSMFMEIVKLLNTKPAISTTMMSPSLPSPDAPMLITKLQSLNSKFTNLTKPGSGSSKYIYIN